MSWMMSRVAASIMIGPRGLSGFFQFFKIAITSSALALPFVAFTTSTIAAIARHFDGHAVSIDATKFPALVAVTLHDVDRATCQEVQSVARRIEGSVVIALERAPACAESNAMRWRIMP